MKNVFTILLVILMLLIGLSTGQALEKKIGHISHIEGSNVKIKARDAGAEQVARTNDDVTRETTLILPANTKVEITWNDGSMSEVSGEKTVKVSELYDTKKSAYDGALSRLWNSLSLLVSAQDKATGSGGNSEKKAVETLHWKTSEADLSKALKLYDQKEYRDCLERLGQIIDRDPNSDQAAIALLTAGLCHAQLDEKQKAEDKLQSFLDKFPDHKLAKNVRQTLDDLKK